MAEIPELVSSISAGAGLEPMVGPERSLGARQEKVAPAPAATGGSDRVEISPEAVALLRRVGAAAEARGEADEGSESPLKQALSRRPERSRSSEYDEALGTFQTTVRVGPRQYQIPPEQLARFRESYGKFIQEHFPRPRIDQGPQTADLLGGGEEEEG